MSYRRDQPSPETVKTVLAIDGKCIAPKVDAEAGPCSGRTTLDHVHDEHGVGKRRATSDIWHLVAICEGHSERGAKGGHIWSTSHRAEERDWLLTHRPARPSGSGSSDHETTESAIA